MYVYTYIRIYVCTYIHIYVYTYMRIYVLGGFGVTGFIVEDARGDHVHSASDGWHTRNDHHHHSYTYIRILSLIHISEPTRR